MMDLFRKDCAKLWNGPTLLNFELGSWAASSYDGQSFVAWVLPGCCAPLRWFNPEMGNLQPAWPL